MEQRKQPISVIVPVYNVEAYLRDCLDSLLAQTYPNTEILLVDDASTDHSGGICDSYAARYAQVRAFHFSENRGPSAARNEGVRRASGTYIAFVDSDDYAEPGLLETLYHVLTETRADVSICGNEGLRLADGPARTYSPQEAARCLARRGPFLWTAWGKLFPTELAKQIPFDRQALCCEDLLFFYQVLKRVRRLTYVPVPLYHYVCRPGSLVNHGVTKKRCRVLTLLEQICEDAAVCFPQAKACFGQVALDTAARLAMQTIENGADMNTQGYLKWFRDHTRRQFSRQALMLCPDYKSAAAQLALWAGIPVFETLAAVYRRMAPISKRGME